MHLEQSPIVITIIDGVLEQYRHVLIFQTNLVYLSIQSYKVHCHQNTSFSASY